MNYANFSSNSTFQPTKSSILTIVSLLQKPKQTEPSYKTLKNMFSLNTANQIVFKRNCSDEINLLVASLSFLLKAISELIKYPAS